MSASIYFLPVKPGISIETHTPSDFIKKIEEGFYSLPVILRKKDLDRVEGMAVIDPQFNDVAKAIIKYGEIRIWAEY